MTTTAQTAALAAITVPAPQATGFFTLPREIRNAIYSWIVESVPDVTYRQRCGSITFTLTRHAYTADKVLAIRNKQLAEEFEAETKAHLPPVLYISDSRHRMEIWCGPGDVMQSIADWPLGATTKVVLCVELTHFTTSPLLGTNPGRNTGWKADCDDTEHVLGLIDSGPPKLARLMHTEIRFYPTIIVRPSDDNTASSDSQRPIPLRPDLPDWLRGVLAMPRVLVVKIFPAQLYEIPSWRSSDVESRLFGSDVASMVWCRESGWQSVT